MTDAERDAGQASRPLVLGSSSRFRRGLLERLGLPFQVRSPDIDETALDGESPRALVERLSLQKARRVASGFERALVIGSDQVALVDGEVMGKPGDHARAIDQLERASGREVQFLTGLAVVDAATQHTQLDLIEVRVGFQALTRERIEAYLRRDQPYQCAGSIRAEGLGVSLFRYVRTDDPSALIGLPLIRLCQMLRDAGLDVLAPGAADEL